jgi:hypothetical protein
MDLRRDRSDAQSERAQTHLAGLSGRFEGRQLSEARGYAASRPLTEIGSGSVHPDAWSNGGRAISQTDHLVLDFEFFALEAAEQQVIRQGTVHFGVDLLLEEGMLVTKALGVVLHGHPFAILRLESLTTFSI